MLAIDICSLGGGAPLAAAAAGDRERPFEIERRD